MPATSPGRHRSSGPPRTAPISPADGGKAFGILGLALVSWLLPQRSWPAACRLLARGLAGAPDSGRRIAALIEGQGLASDPHTIYRASQAAGLESYLQLLREYRPGGWGPSCSVRGTEHLDLALERGNGAVLWLPLFAGYALAAKIALHEAGFDVNHVSHPRHGFSDTRFGVRILNPIRTRAENRYLKSRIMISPESSAAALRESLARLRANEIVSIAAGGAATHPVAVSFLNGELLLAGGGPSLAYATEAALLPVFPLSEGGGSIQVVIEEPLPRKPGEKKTQFVERCAQAFSAHMEDYVRRRPEQWRGWGSLPARCK